ncbi:MAG TPA: hypothetical protein VF482_07700, partial [Trebonia sp.]
PRDLFRVSAVIATPTRNKSSAGRPGEGGDLGGDAQKRINPQIGLAAGSMITKTFFLVKVIHRILIKSLHDKKTLPES